MKSPFRVCVLGGCGAMGRTIVTCLSKKDSCKITVADLHPPHDPFHRSIRFSKVNLLDQAALVRVLKGHHLVINSTSHHFNLPVMKAALKAVVHYLDLGGLFHFTRRQLKLDDAFRKKGLMAILGMGCAPGIANLLAKWAAEGIDQVKEIHIKVGGKTWGNSSDAPPYAIGTIREELTLKPTVYRKGRWYFEKPLSGQEWFQFPPPVGRQKIFRTIHSETATLPMSFPGLDASSFKIGFPDELIHQILHPKTKKTISKTSLNKKLPRDCEITVAVVRGKISGKDVTRIASCKAMSSGKHSAGDWDTAWPPAIVSNMIAKGEIKGAGVFPPEKMVPLHLFLDQLRSIGFKLSKS